MPKHNGKFTIKFENAIERHLFLNDIEDETAKEFIIAIFHEIEHQADIIENLHNKIKRLENIV